MVDLNFIDISFLTLGLRRDFSAYFSILGTQSIIYASIFRVDIIFLGILNPGMNYSLLLLISIVYDTLIKLSIQRFNHKKKVDKHQTIRRETSASFRENTLLRRELLCTPIRVSILQIQVLFHKYARIIIGM